MELWDMVAAYGDKYAESHPEFIYEVMDNYVYFFRNAKSNENQCLHKFWSMDPDERIDAMVDYINNSDNIEFWCKELKENC